MKPVPTLAAATLTAAALTACGSGSNKQVADPTVSSLSPSVHVSHSARPSRSAVPRPSLSAVGAVSTTLDPCQLVTQQEASDMAHASFGPGQEEGTKIYARVRLRRPDPERAHGLRPPGRRPPMRRPNGTSCWPRQRQVAGQAADLVHLTPDSSIADRAEWVELNLPQIGVSGRGLAFLKGAVGVYMIDEVRGGVGTQPGCHDHAGADGVGRLS